MATGRTCTVSGCDKPLHQRGYCLRHYYRVRRYGSTDKPPPRPVRLCSVEGCENKHFSGGYCPKHLQRVRAYGTPELPVRPSLMERFQSKLAEPNERGCRLWLGALDKDGYGSFSTGHTRGKARAHRWIYEQLVGPIPIGRMVLHSCDTPNCCEISHLRVGTAKDNKQDELVRGRNNPPRGRRNPKAVLTEQMVRDIRALYASGMVNKRSRWGARRQAKLWGLNEGTVRSVLDGRNWRHVV